MVVCEDASVVRGAASECGPDPAGRAMTYPTCQR